MPRESASARRERTREILDRLAEAYPDSRCSLYHRSPFELLVATVLSAQCTDARVNQVTPALFARYPDPISLAEAAQEEVEVAIGSVNFFRTKAKALIGLSRALVEEYGGRSRVTWRRSPDCPAWAARRRTWYWVWDSATWKESWSTRMSDA